MAATLLAKPSFCNAGVRVQKNMSLAVIQRCLLFASLSLFARDR